MSSTHDSYLPELSGVFAKDAHVFSWETFLHVLKQDDTAQNDSLSPAISLLLKQKSPSFLPASAQSRNNYDTKTAAINILPTSGKAYNINEIKEDSIWLSNEVKLSEDEALRVTVLEWERRCNQRLLAGYSDAEVASLKDVSGSDDTNNGPNQTFVQRSDERFDTQLDRRRRILVLYFREQAALLGVSKALQEIALQPETRTSKTSTPVSVLAKEVDQTISPDNGVIALLDTVESKLQTLDAGRSWTIEAPQVDDIWVASELQQVRIILEIVILRLWAATGSVLAGETILKWFRLMANCEYFAMLQPSPYLSGYQVESLQVTASLLSLAMLDPASAIAALTDSGAPADPRPFFLNSDVVTELHKILLSAAEACIPQAAPAALGWTMILNEMRRASLAAKDSREGQRTIEQSSGDYVASRRTSYGSLQQSVYEDIMDHVLNASPVSEPVAYMIRCTIEADHALEVIAAIASLCGPNTTMLSTVKLQILQELITVSVADLGYVPDVLSAQFAILVNPSTGQSYGLPDPRETFINNDYLMDNIFAVAAARFPYESLPFLKLCKLLASAGIFDDQGTQYIAYRLKEMDSFTQAATSSFTSYQTIREDENLNLVVLESPADMIAVMGQKQLAYSRNSQVSGILPADTIGEVISESQPLVIKWRHTFSGLAFLGGWLELHYLGQLQTVLSPFEAAEEVATEIIELLSSLLDSTLGSIEGVRDDAERGQLQDDVLRGASANLRADVDVADCVFEIMEQEVQAYRRRPSNTFNTALLVACVKFISTFVQIRPDHFWASINKSSMLESYGTGSSLLALVSGIEVPGQSFPVLEAFSNLYRRVVTVALRCSRSTNFDYTPSMKGQSGAQRLKLQAAVLLSLTQSLYGIFEAMPGWTFSSLSQQTQVIRSLSTSFERVIIYAHGIGEIPSRLTSSFQMSGEFLVAQARPRLNDTIGVTGILRHLQNAIEVGPFVADSVVLEMTPIPTPVQSLLGLIQILLARGKQQAPGVSSLELQLLDSMPMLIRFLPFSPQCTTTTLQVIRCLLEYVAPFKPVSLLGHLGSASCITLLHILVDSQNRAASTQTRVAVWELLTNLVSTSQQWLALVILTGTPPEKVNKVPTGDSHGVLQGEDFLQISLKQLVKIAELPSSLSIAMLEFTNQAQQNWSWTADALKHNQDFLPAIISFVQNTFIDTSSSLQIAYRNKAASLLVDLATVHIYHVRTTRDSNQIKTVVNLLQWLGENAIQVSSYNSSLHTNLRKNFASKFVGLEVSDFKRTGLTDAQYGGEYYYDLTFADEVLHNEQFWYHRSNSEQSFSAELRRANLNLSVVNSELTLLHSFKAFCVEHSGWLVHQSIQQDSPNSKHFHTILTQVIQGCLVANMQVYPSQRLFENLFQSRADLAIALLQRLVIVKAKGFEMKDLLKTAWNCARFSNMSYEQAINNKDLTYWRSTLAIVLLALQFHVGQKWVPPVADQSSSNLLRNTMNDQIPTTLEIISIVIGDGFKTVVNSIQDQRQSRSITDDPNSTVGSKDIAMILTMLDTILRMSRLPEFISEASERLIASGIIQSALLLYSWSHTLTNNEIDNQPVLAYDCLQLLNTLSTLPPVTEEMAIEGVLSRLLSGRVTTKLQSIPDGASYLDKRPNCQFLYTIWATGFLPICLNLLNSVGAPIAAEVSIFLNQFPHQLSRASAAFIPAGQSRASSNTITLTLASEAATLALISFILQSYRVAGASVAIDPTTISPLSGYDEHKQALAEDVSDLINAGVSGLQSRVILLDEKNADLAKAMDGESSLLAKKVYQELKNASLCLKQQEAED